MIAITVGVGAMALIVILDYVVRFWSALLSAPYRILNVPSNVPRVAREWRIKYYSKALLFVFFGITFPAKTVAYCDVYAPISNMIDETCNTSTRVLVIATWIAFSIMTGCFVYRVLRMAYSRTSWFWKWLFDPMDSTLSDRVYDFDRARAIG